MVQLPIIAAVCPSMIACAAGGAASSDNDEAACAERRSSGFGGAAIPRVVTTMRATPTSACSWLRVKDEGEKPLPISLSYINNKDILYFHFPRTRV